MTCRWILFFVVWLGSVIVANGKVIEVMLPLPDMCLHLLHDVGDIAGWNRCVVGRCSYVGLSLAEVMESLENIVQLMLEAVGEPREL